MRGSARPSSPWHIPREEEVLAELTPILDIRTFVRPTESGDLIIESHWAHVRIFHWDRIRSPKTTEQLTWAPSVYEVLVNTCPVYYCVLICTAAPTLAVVRSAISPPRPSQLLQRKLSAVLMICPLLTRLWWEWIWEKLQLCFIATSLGMCILLHCVNL